MRFATLLVLAAMAASATRPAAADDKAALVQRGDYLVNGPMVCADCHTPRGPDMAPVKDLPFAGGFNIQSPGFSVFAANITPDKETGIGAWTDAEIITAIREGKTPKGKIIFPPMPVPTYNTLSDFDAKAIVAYLRTLKPIHLQVPESTYNVPQHPMPPAKGSPAPSPKDKVAYGGYIVNSLAHCLECHSSPDDHGAPDMAHGRGAGGFLISLGPNASVMTPNITPDPETGIGKWSDDDIRKAITLGVRPDGGHLSPPMGYEGLKRMTKQDLDAVVAYIRTLPPIRHAVERTEFQKKAFP